MSRIFGGDLHLLAQEATGAAIVAGIAIGIALALHLFLFAIAGRIARLSQMKSDELVLDRLRQPLRWSLMAVGLSIAAEAQPTLAHLWQSIARFVIPALLGWVAFSLIKAFALAMDSRAELSADDQTARSRRTRIAIFSRTAGFVIVFVTVALMLLGIPGVRNVGVTLMASAGLAGLAVGAAAQPALKSLIAGMQMALTEPVRIGDLVVIEHETGRVEDIRLTYVVVRTADERRLIVPTSKFLDTSFQNWTRVSGGLTGSVVLPIASGKPIAPMREAFLSLLAARPQWDKRTGELQVSDVTIDGVQLKLVMSAKNAGDLARLRLDMREGMIEWLRENMPDALKG
ncbi:MAG TPA: mechanosensitive ion channel domain-containing protein [Sphingomonadaceae bacterium]|nr:mechanosensitive ion channel domain-containing protein [Sphingomonadaceae bacterium]